MAQTVAGHAEMPTPSLASIPKTARPDSQNRSAWLVTDEP
jgi:hypothetical protein